MAKSPRVHTPTKHPKDMTSDELWEKYHKWVEKFAYAFSAIYRTSISDHHVLLGAGFEGLQRAAQTWDPQGKAGFMSYSRRSIINYVRRAADQELVRKPFREMMVYKYPQIVYTGNFDSAFTYQDLDDAPESDMARNFVKYRKIQQYRNHRADCDNSGFSRPADELAIPLADFTLVKKHLDCLDARSREVIECFFGLNGKGATPSFSSLAPQFGVSRQRIFQLFSVAMYKLQKAMGVPTEEPKHLARARAANARWKKAQAAKKREKAA